MCTNWSWIDDIKSASNMCNPTFPSRDELLDWTVERWEELGVGYRARYLANAVQVCDKWVKAGAQ